MLFNTLDSDKLKFLVDELQFLVSEEKEKLAPQKVY